MKKKILILTIVFLGIFVSYRYFQYEKYFNNEELYQFSYDVFIQVLNYVDSNEKIDLTNKMNFKTMIYEIEKKTFIVENNKEILNYDKCAFKYDKKSGFYIFYFKVGNINSDKISYSLKEVDSKREFSNSKPTFFEFLIDNKFKFNIALFAYKPG